MSYKDKFKQADTEAFNASIARDILERMTKLRLEAKENMKRRWVWELIQNAKDVAQINLPVEIKLDLSDDKLLFCHNGKCFTANDITFLIRQVSNKDREASEQEFDYKTTGKFGTGFLTTHLLSEQVEITGVAKEPELDYRQFVLPLDRSGRTKDEIEQSVNKSIEVRDTLDEKPTYRSFNPNDFNTTFSYNLNEEGEQVAKIGINDLRTSLPYTLAFSTMIKSVNIVNQNLIYEVVSRTKLNEDIELCKIAFKSNDNFYEIFIIKLASNNVAIATEIEYQNGRAFIKEFAEELPRLFCDFPLIGTETFNMPVIINSSDFNPTEPRDGVWLTDKDSEPEIIQNKELFLEAVSLYYKLLDYAVENKWGNLYNLANTNMPEEKEWFSKDWIEKIFQKPAREKLKKLSIVELENGNLAPINENNNNVYFPHHTKDDVRGKIWDLEYKLFPNNVPAKRNINEWDKVLWSDCFKDSLKAITEFVSREKTIEELSKRLDNDLQKAMYWLNDFYDLLNFEGEVVKEIINDKYAIIPNQLGIFKKRKELYIDCYYCDNEGKMYGKIEEELKNVLCILGYDPKNDLLHNEVRKIIEQISFYAKNQDDIIESINKTLKDNNKNNKGKARNYLISLFCNDNNFPKHRELLYNYCKQLIKEDEIPEKRFITTWEDSIWENVDSPCIKRLVEIVGKQKNLSGLKTYLGFQSEKETIEWLNDFIQFLKERGLGDQLNSRENPSILPNQNGDFCTKEDLTFDSGEIDETLKDILEALDCQIRKELIDNHIFLELSKTAERKSEYVASEISQRITPKFSELPRSENTKEIFKKLYLWFNNNKDAATRLFPDLYTNKHKLFDDEQLASLLEDKEEIFNENAKLKEENRLLKTRNEELEKLLEEKKQYEQEKKSLEEKLEELKTNNPESPEIIEIEARLTEINNQINPIEDTIIAIEKGFGDLGKQGQIDENIEAKKLVKERLEIENYVFPDNYLEQYSTINGVTKDGVEYPLVVKSYKYAAASLKIGANEWIQLMKKKSMFWAHFGNGKLGCIKMGDLLRNQEKLTINFSTKNLDAFRFSEEDLNDIQTGNLTGLDIFAKLLHYFNDVHFDFDSISPDNYSTADKLNDYRFDHRKTEKDISDTNSDIML
jgi:hypothetical protein